MLSPKNTRRLLQILPFGIISALFSLAYVLIERGILGDAPTYPSTGNPYNSNWLLSVLVAFGMGSLIGLIEVAYLRRWYQNSSLLKKVAYKTFTYVVLILLFTIITSTISHAVELGVRPWDPLVGTYVFNFMSDFAFWSIVIYIAMGMGISLFYTEVSDNIGQGVLINFLTGKYHRAIEEERIFMFLDMKASTTIAERLGHVRYFSMLKQYYADLSDPIIQYGGQIYQYVGDEIVVTWRHQKGVRGNNCLDCFTAMKAALRSREAQYRSAFGLAPTFKAGIHLGRVTSGEIGVVKREIIFSGDVLNTTARIQGLCNQYKVDLLVSEQLTDTLVLPPDWEGHSLGEVSLRGRNEKIKLYTIRPVG